MHPLLCFLALPFALHHGWRRPHRLVPWRRRVGAVILDPQRFAERQAAADLALRYADGRARADLLLRAAG